MTFDACITSDGTYGQAESNASSSNGTFTISAQTTFCTTGVCQAYSTGVSNNIAAGSPRTYWGKSAPTGCGYYPQTRVYYNGTPTVTYSANSKIC